LSDLLLCVLVSYFFLKDEKLLMPSLSMLCGGDSCICLS